MFRRNRRKPLIPRWQRTKHAAVVLLVLAVSYCLVRYGLAPVGLQRAADSIEQGLLQGRTQALVNSAAWLLDNQLVSREQGDRLLELALRPEVIKRLTYPVGKRPIAQLRVTTKMRFEICRTKAEHWSIDDGSGREGGGGGTDGGDQIGGITRSNALDRPPDKPGQYTMVEGYRYALTPGKKSLSFGTNRFGPLPPVIPWYARLTMFFGTKVTHDDSTQPGYECEFEVPIVFDVVETEDAEKIEVLSNPGLDAAMAAAIQCATSMRQNWSFSRPIDDATMIDCSGRGDIQFSSRSLPENICFDAWFRDRNGKEVPFGYRDEDEFTPTITTRHKDESIGFSFEFYEPAIQLGVGKHKGEIVLRTNVEKAYDDPEIKTLWDGELTFPAEFEVLSSTTTSRTMR